MGSTILLHSILRSKHHHGHLGAPGFTNLLEADVYFIDSGKSWSRLNFMKFCPKFSINWENTVFYLQREKGLEGMRTVILTLVEGAGGLAWKTACHWIVMPFEYKIFQKNVSYFLVVVEPSRVKAVTLFFQNKSGAHRAKSRYHSQKYSNLTPLIKILQKESQIKRTFEKLSILYHWSSSGWSRGKRKSPPLQAQ